MTDQIQQRSSQFVAIVDNCSTKTPMTGRQWSDRWLFKIKGMIQKIIPESWELNPSSTAKAPKVLTQYTDYKNMSDS